MKGRFFAMRDVYQEWQKRLNDIAREFPCEAGQTGLIAFIRGEVAGLEIISSPRVFGLLFPKLLRSYILEAQEIRGNWCESASPTKARAFVKHLGVCKVSRHPSVGYGEDVRFQTDSLVGSALLYQSTIIHAVIFARLEDDRPKAGSTMRYRPVPVRDDCGES